MVDIGLPLWRRRLGQSACHKITSAAASLALLACPGLANAWGPQGHKTIGLIAEHYLTNSQRDEVQRLLALPIDPPVPANMADRATWADVYRDSDRNTTKERYNATHNWHFVDVDIEKPDLKAACFGDAPLPAGTLASQGPEKDCVARKIEQFQAELANHHLADTERALALNYLLHFVGDIHQPLHAAEHDNDQGGNKVFVVAGQAQYGDTQHGYWDSVTVARLGSGPGPLSAALIADITPADLKAWRKGGPRDWAMESYASAKTIAYAVPTDTRPCLIKVYGKPPRHETCRQLTKDYPAIAAGRAQRQLQMAGVRLADIIAQALK